MEEVAEVEFAAFSLAPQRRNSVGLNNLISIIHSKLRSTLFYYTDSFRA